MFIYDDNFLTPEEVSHIDEVFNSTYDWKYCNILEHDDSIGNIKYFTADPQEGSREYQAALFILNKMLTKHQISQGSVNRVKFNMTPPYGRSIVASPHRDMEEEHMVFLYYVNNAHGDTIIYDGLEMGHIVSPRRGAAIVFDGRKHAWSTPHEGPIRQVINIAFYR
jgi:hypothetical protein